MAFGKASAAATNVGPKSFDTTPGTYTSLGTLLDPTKPDVRDLYIQTFGDQGITGLLDVTGAKRSAGTADEIHWYEEGRINHKFKATLTASTDLLTLTEVDGTAVGSLSGKSAADYIRPNDVFLAASGRRYIVSGTVSSTDDSFTAVVKDMDGTDVATVDAQEMTIIGNAWGQGTPQPTKPFEMDLKLRKNPYIIAKETFHVNGSQATNIGWLNVNGQNLWYLKGEMDARRKFMNTREAMLVFGQSNQASGGDNGTGAGISTANGTVTGSEGYFQAVERRGIVSSTAADQDFATMDDIDNILIQLDKEGAPAEYAMYLNRATSLAIDDMLANGIGTATSAGLAGQFGAFNNNPDMAVQLGFKTFTRGGYTFHKHDWKLLNSDYAAGFTDYQGAMIPLGSVVDPKNGGSNPSLEMNYKAAGNYSREMEHWVEGGGVLGYATNGEDLAKFHYRSECNLCVRAANQHVVLKGALS